MTAPTLCLAELLLDARKDLPSLRAHLDAPLQRLSAEFTQNGGQPITHLLPWRSPGKHDWLILLHYGAEAVRVFSLLRFRDGNGDTAALWTGPSGPAYHLQPEALQSYAEHIDPTVAAKEAVQSFFLDNPYFEMQVETPRGEHDWDVTVGMHQGLGLGTWDTTTDIVHVRNFIPLAQLQAPEIPVEALASPFKSLSTQERIALADRAAEVERKQRAA